MEYLVIMLDPTLGLEVFGDDVRITNTNSASQHNVKTEKVILRHEKGKKENIVGKL